MSDFNHNKKIKFLPLPYIGMFDLDLIYQTSDVELLYQILYRVNEIVRSQHIIIDNFNNILTWANTQIEKYTKQQLQEWLDDGTFEDIINELLNKMVDTYNETYDSIVSTNIENYGYDELMNEFNQFKIKYSLQCTFLIIGKSYLGRDIPMICLGNMNGTNKALIIGNQHARELHTAQLIMKQIEFICENWERNFNGEQTKDIFSNTCYFIIPNINPDGSELVINGLSSIPQSTPNYNDLINNIKQALENKIRNNISKLSDVDESWDLYNDIVWSGNTGKIPSYSFREQDLFLWKSNLQGIDIHLNMWKDGINRIAYNQALSSGQYTQGQFASENDIGTVGFGATENTLLNTVMNTYGVFQYSLFYHGRTPVVQWNYSLNNEVLNRSYAIAKYIGKQTSTHLSSGRSSRVGSAGYMYSNSEVNQSQSFYNKTNSIILETGYMRFPPINNDNGDYLPTAPIMASPLKNNQEEYIWKYNKYSMISYEYFVRNKDNWNLYSEQLIQNENIGSPTVVLRGLNAEGSADSSLYAGAYGTREAIWQRIGNIIFVNVKLVITSLGTLNSESSNGIAIEVQGIPPASSDKGDYIGTACQIKGYNCPLSDKNGLTVNPKINAGSKLILLYASNLTGGNIIVRQQDITNEFTINMQLMYNYDY